MAKILLCDDSAFMRGFEKKLLVAKGHEIIGEATNGVEAVKLYWSCKPDLAIMDISMPDLDGISAVKQIASQDVNARIIMVSAVGHKKFIIEALDAGAVDFIVKPFETKQFVRIVENALTKEINNDI